MCMLTKKAFPSSSFQTTISSCVLACLCTLDQSKCVKVDGLWVGLEPHIENVVFFNTIELIVDLCSYIRIPQNDSSQSYHGCI